MRRLRRAWFAVNRRLGWVPVSVLRAAHGLAVAAWWEVRRGR